MRKQQALATPMWPQSEQRLMQWLTFELDENPHLRRVLQKYTLTCATSKINFATR